MTRADAALMISFLSIGLSLSGLIWQMVHYHLSGPRIRVDLRPGIYTHRGTFVTGPAEGWPARPPVVLAHAGVSESDLWVDCASIVVTNHGRAAATVLEVGVSFQPVPLDDDWSLVGRTVEIARGEGSANNVRIEPGDAKLFVIFPWPLITYGLSQVSAETLLVRGRARVAGRARAVLSPQQTEWRIKRCTSHLFPYWKASPQATAFQLLAHEWPSSDVTELYSTTLGVFNALTPVPDAPHSEILEALDAFPLMRRFSLLRELEAIKLPDPFADFPRTDESK